MILINIIQHTFALKLYFEISSLWKLENEQIQSLNAKDTKLFLSWLDLKSIADEEKQGEEGELNELIRTSTITTDREEDTT